MKLKKREIIILGVMGVAILFAAYSFLMPARKLPPGTDTTQTGDVQVFLDKIREKTTPAAKDIHSDIVFARITREWKPDPFLDGSSYQKWLQAQIVVKTTPPVPRKVKFEFTGYLATPQYRMAIVNGIEYREGDRLEPNNYVLKNATPTNITIVNTVTGAKETVPLQDDGGLHE